MISISERAIKEVRRIVSEQDLPDDTVLRVGVKGGGCSGFSYSLGFDDTVQETDQVFERDGTFVEEAFVSLETRDLGTAYGLALSKDADQQWLFVNDGSNNKIWILRRSDLEVVGSFASYGRMGGQVMSAHSMVVDQENNIYVGETRGRRVQKFALQGM